MDNIQSTNGNGTNYDQEAVSQNLQEEATVGYLPQLPLEGMWQTGTDMPSVTLRRDIYFMQIHPIVINALEYYKSGISGAEFWGGPDHANPDNDKGKDISPDPQVSMFVMAHVERFWQRGVHLLQEEGYPHGWCPGEHIYKEINTPNAFGKNMLVWSHLKTFQPVDGHILTLGYNPIGVRVKNIRSKQPIDLHLASNSIPAKGCWYAHRPRSSSLYGRSQLLGAWLPWRMLGWRDGMDQVINAAVYRAGYKGPIVKHPPGHSAPTARSGIPATQVDGGGLARREHRDVARQMIEWAKAGAGFTMSSEQYPAAQGGGPKWELEWPDHVMDVSPLINAANWAEDRILLGIGVPPELVKPGGTGSGYSGRSIPREAFLDGQQKVADAFLQMFVEQVLRPLVLWNFGDIPFNVQCKSLLKTQSDDKQGELPSEGNQDPGQTEQPQDPSTLPQGNPGEQPEAPPSQVMSISDKLTNKVMSIVEKVRRKGVSNAR